MSSLDRRSFLRAAAIGLAATAAPSQTRRPNILFCISDDQSYPHASAYGTPWINTPAFDRVAREGALFHHAFVSTPSCCPSRGAALTGQDFYRLREASMNHTVWPSGGDIPVYTDLLGEAGYLVGFTGKGWGPGNYRVAGRTHNPAGPEYNDIQADPPGHEIAPMDYAASFEAFLDERTAGQPFCFWAGFIEPHRKLDEGIGVEHGKKLKRITPPAFFPDSAEVRGDVADYAFEIEYFDNHLGRMLDALETRGELDNTLIVCTSDNGMAFPRAKATLYDYGARMPLAIRWGDRVEAGRVLQDFVSHRDYAPTFLEAAGLPVPPEMTGRSLMPVLESDASGQIDPDRNFAVFGIERHFPGSRPNGAGYPMRAIRTADYLYIRNLEPENDPVGIHPGPFWPDDDPTGGYGDTDGGPAKTYMHENRDKHPDLYAKAFKQRPAEELYVVNEDEFNLDNVADDDAYKEIKEILSKKLDTYLETTKDPRAIGKASELEAVMKQYPVIGSNN